MKHVYELLEEQLELIKDEIRFADKEELEELTSRNEQIGKALKILRNSEQSRSKINEYTLNAIWTKNLRELNGNVKLDSIIIKSMYDAVQCFSDKKCLETKTILEKIVKHFETIAIPNEFRELLEKAEEILT